MGNQQEYLDKYKEESLKQLKPEHADIVADFLSHNEKIQPNYMMTIARDGEHPARSIYNYGNAVDAVTGYNRYVDWGFAKDYLTVTLYGPGGKIAEKVLKRPKGGECTFIKSDYIEAEKIILNVKPHLPEDIYVDLVKDFAGLFSRDNIRFDVSRFFKATECEEVFE